MMNFFQILLSVSTCAATHRRALKYFVGNMYSKSFYMWVDLWQGLHME